MKLNFFKTDPSENCCPALSVNRQYNFEDFDAVFVNRFDRYCQRDYDRIINTQKAKSIELYAWKNDKATAEFAILCAEKDLNKISVTASALTGENGSLPSLAISLSFIKEVRAYTGHAGWYANNPRGIMPRGQREYYPEVIYSDKPVSLDKGKLQLVFAEINVPKDASAGKYFGEVTVSAENSDKTVTLNISLDVLDAILPDPQDYLFDTEYWSHPYNVAYYYGVEPFSDAHLKILEQHMAVYRSLGGHAVTASIAEEAWGGQTYGGNSEIHYPSMIKWIKSADGEWRFDYTHFDKWVKLNKNIGIADKIICYSMMPWKNVIRYYDEAKNKMIKMRVNPASKDSYRKAWTPFLKDFIAHLDSEGLFDSTYIGFDERRNMETALDLIEAVKNKDGKSLKISASFNSFKSNAAVFSRLDYASVGLQEIRDNLENFKNQVTVRNENGQETSMYTATEHVPNSFTKSVPAESYWSIMFAGSLNATGFLRWAFDAWVENPLEESTHWSFPAGDCFLVYPSERNEEPKSRLSLRLAMLDEGVRDVNKLYFMRKNLPEMSAEIENLFSEIKGIHENDYEFYTMKRTNIWGRTAKWLNEKGKNDMLDDMEAVKQKIYEISKKYCEINGKCK